jgi:GNAT superfamily N-acetyltransferase
MNIDEIRALYDEEQRRSIEYTTLRREAVPHVVRHVDLFATDGVVLYSDLDEHDADTVIDEQIAYFESLSQSFEWKYFEHDKPHDLLSRLSAKGFEIGDEEAIVVLDVANLPTQLSGSTGHDLRRLDHPDQVREALSVQDRVWPDGQSQTAQIEHELRNVPDTISVYAVYDQGKAVASAWVRFHDTSQFASLWAGAVLPDYRHRGIYTALIAVRAKEALERGARFLTVDAGPMSRPILERLGFEVLTLSRACKWRLKTPASEAGGRI